MIYSDMIIDTTLPDDSSINSEMELFNNGNIEDKKMDKIVVL